MIQQETKGNYPAPMAALELMLETCQLSAEAASHCEAEGMAELFGSPVNAALINVFFLTDRNKRDTGLDKSNVTAAAVKSVGVDRQRHHGRRHRGGDAEKRDSARSDRCECRGAGPRGQASAGRSGIQPQGERAGSGQDAEARAASCRSRIAKKKSPRPIW